MLWHVDYECSPKALSRAAFKRLSNADDCRGQMQQDLAMMLYPVVLSSAGRDRRQALLEEYLKVLEKLGSSSLLLGEQKSWPAQVRAEFEKR